jgi:hypothetical protein
MHRTPLTTAFEQVQHAAKHFVQIYLWGFGSPTNALQHWPDLFKSFFADVTWIFLSYPYSLGFLGDHEQPLTSTVTH